MKYTLLIYESQKGLELRTDPSSGGNYMSAWRLYASGMMDAGLLAGGSGLDLPETATVVRVIDGKQLVQDGPYAETKEQLGGFFVIDVANLDEALSWAIRAPIAPGGLVEVRPCIPTPG